VFDLGSLTKPVFAAAVLRLRDRGMIDLDAPLLSYLDYPDVRGQAGASKVTARHVLSHTTGLPNWRPFAPGSPLELKATPGERFGYSGEGFFWLQQVIEEVTSTPTARLVQQEVFGPLALERSSLVFESRFASNYAQGHRGQGTPPVDSHSKQSADRVRRALGPGPADLQDIRCAQARAALIASDPALAAGPSPVLHPANAAGSLQATAADYARFLTAFVSGARARSLLGAPTVKEMLSKQTAINRHTAYGLGWRLEQTHEGTVFWHSGYNDGFHSFALGDPTGRFGVVAVTNSDRGDWLRWPVVHGATGRGEAAILS
jgi:CubicO group peptidase (beta-lactamase class C family)